MGTLIEKLTAVQSELKVGKNRVNEFGKFNYRSASDLEEAIKPLLAKFNLSLYISNDVVEVGGRVYVKSIATLTDGTDTIVTTAFAREDEVRAGMSESQTTGCAASYATKYNLANMFLVDDTDDADAFNNKKPQNKPTFAHQNPEWTPTPQQSYEPANEPEMEPQKENPVYLGLKEFCRQAKPYEDHNELKKFFNFWAKKTGNWRGNMDYQKLWNNWKQNIRPERAYA